MCKLHKYLMSKLLVTKLYVKGCPLKKYVEKSQSAITHFFGYLPLKLPNLTSPNFFQAKFPSLKVLWCVCVFFRPRKDTFYIRASHMGNSPELTFPVGNHGTSQ